MGIQFPCTISVQQWRHFSDTQLDQASIFRETNGFEDFGVCFDLGHRRKWKLGLLGC
jgi:hypothetical protein